MAKSRSRFEKTPTDPFVFKCYDRAELMSFLKQWLGRGRRSTRTVPGGDAFIGSLRPYVCAPDVLPRSVRDGAPEILPGIVVAVAVDGLSRVDFLPRPSMLEIARQTMPDSGGRGPTLIRELAIRNLRALPLPPVRKFSVPGGKTDGDVFLFEGQDSFVASRITFLNDLVEHAAPRCSRKYGLLVAIPRRRTVLLHIPSGPAVLAVLGVMGTSSRSLYDESTESHLSPHVYFVAPDGQTQIAVSPTDDGGVEIKAVGLLGEMLYGPSGVITTWLAR